MSVNLEIFRHQDIFLVLSPLYIGPLMLIFILSRKWIHDKILLASTATSVFCLLAYSTGHTTLAVAIICSSNTVLIIYSMFFRRRGISE